MTSSVSFTRTSLDKDLGALLIGGLVAMALWGVTCIQTYQYFTRKSLDGPAFKTKIAFLSALDIVDSTLTAHILYHYMVANYSNPLALLSEIWSALAGVTTVSDFIIRTMFTLRVYKFGNKNLIVTAWITILSLTGFVSGVYITIEAARTDSFMRLQRLSAVMCLNFASSNLADLTIAISLCYLLSRSRTGFRRTDSILRVLILYTMNTGLIVALDTSLLLAAYVMLPQSFVFFGFYFPLSKLYLSSYLAGLNARAALRDRLQNEGPLSINSQFLARNVEPSSLVFEITSFPRPLLLNKTGSSAV
ncbi:hypothetical protein BDN72DRAFT_302904 [Pluteus cervinus]|uniref:Uncharacterized protein n=1 Tax=Pluteus cervinus TaxID=181527 RepID=A0ACD3B3J7_9AGAR|nr:hypothetical protein BDN72DRAFT_302904 [Pluteus cervinus]